MRAIDADAFKDYIRGACEEMKHLYKDNGAWAKEITESFCKDIDEQPTIQPEPKRGKWIKTARWGRVYYCDQCRNYLYFDGVNAGRGSTNYCPNCGCRMDGGEQ